MQVSPTADCHYRLNKSGYMQHRTEPRCYQHRDVWEAAHGPIPPNCHIHHKNRNRADNRLENLECMDAEQHLRMHGLTFEMVNHLNRLRNSHPVRQYACIACDKECVTKHPNAKFCSRVCAVKYNNWLNDAAKAARRLESRADRKCEWCKTEFTPKDSKGRFCCQQCSTQARYETERQERAVNRGSGVCPECGTQFIRLHKANQKYCSKRCTHIVQNRNYRARKAQHA